MSTSLDPVKPVVKDVVAQNHVVKKIATQAVPGVVVPVVGHPLLVVPSSFPLSFVIPASSGTPLVFLVSEHSHSL